MVKLDEHLRIIGAAILDQAENDSREVRENADEQRASTLREWEDTLERKMQERVQKQTGILQAETRTQLALRETELHRGLLTRRRELLEQIFAAARANIAAYTETPRYRQDVFDHLTELKTAYDHTSTTIRLRQADMEWAGAIQALLGGGAAVTADRDIRIGGFTLENKGASVLVDETLDTKLSDARPWFLARCTMKVH